MSHDITDAIDEYCEQEYGHTNWAWVDTVETIKLTEEGRGHVEGMVFIYTEDKCSECDAQDWEEHEDWCRAEEEDE